MDGVIPSNKDQGYILRRLLRRMARAGLVLGIDLDHDISSSLVGEVVEMFSWIYPDLVEKQKAIEETFLEEENKFEKILEKGHKQVAKFLVGFSGTENDLAEQAFKFYQSMGYPYGIFLEDVKDAGIKVDVEKCYFSPRLSNERLRITKQIKPKEKVLVMFSGVAPYPIVIARNTKIKKIICVELNPIAHKFALENLKLNKVEDAINLYKGNVAEVVPKLGKFDRILMPLPKSADHFLPTALKASKKDTKIHFYCFSSEEDLKYFKDLIKKECSKARKKCRILRAVKAGSHKPRVYRYCIDFKVI